MEVPWQTRVRHGLSSGRSCAARSVRGRNWSLPWAEDGHPVGALSLSASDRALRRRAHPPTPGFPRIGLRWLGKNSPKVRRARFAQGRQGCCGARRTWRGVGPVRYASGFRLYASRPSAIGVSADVVGNPRAETGGMSENTEVPR
jgi:hypothetical protein